MNMATPALGPSLGVAPAGTWTWMSLLSNAGLVDPEARGAWVLTRLSAAWALSFITSPSWPVRISLPRAGRLGRLDEEDVAARPASRRGPVATPGMLVRMATSFSNRGWPEDRSRSVSAMRTWLGGALGDTHGDVAQDPADLALQASAPRPRACRRR